MIVLVTGGCGFIGSHLCQRLISEGHYVICMDNLYTGSLSNVKELLKHPRFEFIRHDVIENKLIEVEQIYHLACPASPVHYQYNPIKTIKTNILGTMNMLGLAKRVKARILLTSTSEVYGDPLEHPQKETYWGNVNPNGIRSCYDEGKRCAETLMCDYHREHNVDIRIARIFNTYGPNMNILDGRVVSNFITQALQGKDITIYGDGSQTRCLCYVDDLVDGLVRLMNHSGGYTGPVNLGNERELSVNEIAKIIKSVTGSDSNIRYHELPKDDPKRRCPDISLARSMLDWRPTISLMDGLRRSISYFRGIYDENCMNAV